MPSADTIQKYYEALTPEIRQEARQVEAFLRDVSEIIKGNYFQFLSSTKRVQILGDAALSLADFDYDPNTLVPACGDAAQTDPNTDHPRKIADVTVRFFIACSLCS